MLFRSVGWATTDADGEYTLKVAAGSYRVGFNLYSTSTSNATEYFDDVKTIDDAKDLVVGGGLALAGINAELAPLVTPPTEPTTPPTTPTTPVTPPTTPTTPVTPPTTPTTPVTPPAIGDSGPQNTVPATTVGQDGSVLVTGSGFQPFEEVVIWLHSTPVKLGTLIADKSGKDRKSVV